MNCVFVHFFLEILFGSILVSRETDHPPLPYVNIITYFSLRDGPLENLWGGAGEVQKKNSRKGKLNEKKFMHAT